MPASKGNYRSLLRMRKVVGTLSSAVIFTAIHHRASVGKQELLISDAKPPKAEKRVLQRICRQAHFMAMKLERGKTG